MRRAMAEAEVGDDVFGEDPTIARLESRSAELLGKEAALYLPSGTMANQCAIHVHCRPGDELICDERAHVFRYEGGAVARLSGVQIMTVRTEGGWPSSEQLDSSIRRDDPHFPRSRLLVLEQTHNMFGGRVTPQAEFDALCDQAHDRGLRVHVDGARLMNAAVATGRPAADLVARADTLSLCLSKGLGAPVGSMLAGAAEFVAEARRARKAFGGGMRQAGILAAAGLLALEEGPSRLGTDHARSAEICEAARGTAGLTAEKPDTNIVMIDVDNAPALVEHLRQHSVLALAVSPSRVRFVTHRDLERADVDRALQAIQSFDPRLSDTESS